MNFDPLSDIKFNTSKHSGVEDSIFQVQTCLKYKNETLFAYQNHQVNTDAEFSCDLEKGV